MLWLLANNHDCSIPGVVFVMKWSWLRWVAIVDVAWLHSRKWFNMVIEPFKHLFVVGLSKLAKIMFEMTARLRFSVNEEQILFTYMRTKCVH